jgi:hypothetical protein
LPNQLRALAKENKMADVEESLDHLRDALFWNGYELWKKRKILVTKYWQTVAPKEWKIDYKEKKSRNKRKLRSNCKNPFHYCERRYEISNMRRTVCACSDIKKNIASEKLPDIRCFIGKYPKRVASSDPRISGVQKTGNFVVNIFGALSRDDLIRKEHDRGKRKRNE